jgi:predicted unusual protein kinase regulating ubiquinone biosynthesis (AarF/ABC1/UbiB family)
MLLLWCVCCSVPPYMSLLARSVATLEGIALTADPNYQMVAQVSMAD